MKNFLFLLIISNPSFGLTSKTKILLENFFQQDSKITPETLFSLLPTKEANQLDHGPIIQKIKASYPEYVGNYLDIGKVEEKLKAWEKQYPDIVKLEILGITDGKRPQYSMKISDDVHRNDSSETDIMITSLTHGDELITVEVVVRLIDELLAKSTNDPRYKSLLEKLEMYWVPIVNPDGYSITSRNDGKLDPNREYPWPGDERKISVTSINNMISFFQAHDFKGTLDIHAAGRMIMYPWGYTEDDIPLAHKKIFEELGNKMNVVNRYQVGKISKLAYISPGSSADYYYWKNNSIAFGIEIADKKVPFYKTIPYVYEEASEMVWIFLENFI